jgi:asparagine synthase (glutamine-hydrolysing)
MRNYHLARVDKVCMGVGLEPRSPFLDLNVVNAGLAIPAALKRKNNTPKGLLIEAFAPLLPAWMIERKKQPFTVPITKWLPGELYDFTHDLLLPNNAFVRTFLDPAILLRQLKRGQSINDALAHRIWSLLQIEVWHRGFAREMGK